VFPVQFVMKTKNDPYDNVPYTEEEWERFHSYHSLENDPDLYFHIEDEMLAHLVFSKRFGTACAGLLQNPDFPLVGKPPYASRDCTQHIMAVYTLAYWRDCNAPPRSKVLSLIKTNPGKAGLVEINYDVVTAQLYLDDLRKIADANHRSRTDELIRWVRNRNWLKNRKRGRAL
jgi:hypothetical protein